MSYPPREGSRDIAEALIISNYPDYCRSPKDIIPYNIFAYQSDDANTATSVRFTGKKAHTTGSIETCCYGDEAGIGLGISSGTQLSICEAKTFSKTVRIEGKHALRHGDTCYMNNRNTTGKVCYVKDVKTYQPTPQIEKIFQQENARRYIERAALNNRSNNIEVEPSIPTGLPTDALSIRDTDLGPIGISGQDVAQLRSIATTNLARGMPFTTTGGSGSSKGVGDVLSDLSNELTVRILNLTLSLGNFTSTNFITRAINKQKQSSMASSAPVEGALNPPVSEEEQKQRDAATISEIRRLKEQNVAITEDNTRVTSTSANTPPPDCNQMADEIRKTLYANKRAPGETDTYHGYLNRIVEQMCGRNGPGTKTWGGHVEALNDGRNRLMRQYKNYIKKDCGTNGKLTRTEKLTIDKLLDKDHMPQNFQWLGPDHPLCLNVGDVVKNGRLNELLGIIRP